MQDDRTILDILVTPEQQAAVKARLATLRATVRDAMVRHRQAEHDFDVAMGGIDPCLKLDGSNRVAPTSE